MCRELQLPSFSSLCTLELTAFGCGTYKPWAHWRRTCNSSECSRMRASLQGAQVDHFVRYSGSSAEAEVLPPSPACRCVLAVLRFDDPSDRGTEQYHRVAALDDSAIAGYEERGVRTQESADAAKSGCASCQRPDPGAGPGCRESPGSGSVDPGSPVGKDE